MLVKDFLNPPPSKSADPVVRAGGSYTGRGGVLQVLPKPKETEPKFKENWIQESPGKLWHW